MSFFEKIVGLGIGDTFKKVASVFKVDPTVVAQNEAELRKLEYELASKVEDSIAREVESVNATMREEAKSDHFLQWSWRPIVGYSFSAMIVK